ncbi:MAG: sigma-54-dependent transcriptional regulator, partial [Blastocatellia bacterium]
MAKKANVLVVDDEEVIRDVISSLLEGEGYQVDLAGTGEEGLDRFQQRAYDIVLLDVSMPGIGGLRTLEELLKLDAEAVVIVVTAYATFKTAVSAMQRGAFSCVEKPFDNKELIKLVASGIRRRRKDEERRALRQTLKRSTQSKEIVARSEKMLETLAFVEQVAPARTTILITGESGTGKELIARAIHNHSSRSDKPFVTVNSANLPTELLESELFGHARGAFTGALAAKKGYFEVADAGSIFLDEIGTISIETQAKLLRVIQERDFTPLGETAPRQVDVRIIAATNVDLRQAVDEGLFREDLYYRLNVISINLPPLRDRREDILPLTQHFIRKYAEENGKDISDQIEPEVLSALESYHWPGNVRELENVIERAVIIAKTAQIDREYLREEVLNPRRELPDNAQRFATQIDISRGISFYDEVNRFQVELIKAALDYTGGHQSR